MFYIALVSSLIEDSFLSLRIAFTEFQSISDIKSIFASLMLSTKRCSSLYVLNNECVDNVISNGDFVILYPEDAHMPCVCVGKPQTVKKVVIKVPVK